MKIFVSGAAGFIGRRAIPHLIAAHRYGSLAREGVAFSLRVQYGKQRAFLLPRHSGLPLGPALRSVLVQGGANPADGDRDLTSTSAST